jgi:hypothetical protein
MAEAIAEAAELDDATQEEVVEETPKPTAPEPAPEPAAEEEPIPAVPTEQLEEQAATDDKAALIAPHEEALTTLVKDRKITPALRKTIENAIVDGTITQMFLGSLAQLEASPQNLSGVQQGSSQNSLVDAVNRIYNLE